MYVCSHSMSTSQSVMTLGQSLADKTLSVFKLIRADKPTGLILLLLPALMTLSHINQLYSTTTLIVTLGAFSTRSLGCIINDICDRDIDGHVTRTKTRPLASGNLSLFEAALIALVLSLLSLYIASYVPRECYHWIALTAAMICIYPLAKRFFFLPQIILGLTFAQCVFLTAILCHHSINMSILALYFATCFWVISFDTTYALSDYEDDKKLSIYTAVKTLGVEHARVFSVCLHCLSQIIISTLCLTSFTLNSLVVLLPSWIIFFIISQKTYGLEKLDKSIGIFNWHIVQGLTWVFALYFW